MTSDTSGLDRQSTQKSRRWKPFGILGEEKCLLYSAMYFLCSMELIVDNWKWRIEKTIRLTSAAQLLDEF
jgi:hypothetical protein